MLKRSETILLTVDENHRPDSIVIFDLGQVMGLISHEIQEPIPSAFERLVKSIAPYIGKHTIKWKPYVPVSLLDDEGKPVEVISRHPICKGTQYFWAVSPRILAECGLYDA